MLVRCCKSIGSHDQIDELIFYCPLSLGKGFSSCEAYKSELTEFIELVQAGQESELHRLEQQAMLRHPNIVRTTIAAEMSWKQGKTVKIADVQPTKSGGYATS